ncbi:hypothetical protein [Halomonas caseinilytica]|uniref:hypothetical protein n=1 Tax=Halomonas caseinilytica TaxID=438744 RepID=UPI0010BE6D74|nr:hypothetical protein [Halomonas caseinilytica]
MRVLPLWLSAVFIAGLAGGSYQPARIGTEPTVIIDGSGWHDRDHRSGDNKHCEYEKRSQETLEGGAETPGKRAQALEETA